MIDGVIDNLKKVRRQLRNKRRNTLLNMIGYDLLRFGKLPLCLLMCIIVTAVMIVNITYRTRLLITQREQLVLENNTLNIEWHNLILEENMLGDYNRVERIAMEKLQLQHINQSQENILVQK